MLKTVNLVKNYGKKRAVRGVDISVNRGEIVGLLGPNGAGKTTIFYSVTGIIRPTSGKIILGDKDISAVPLFKRARLGLGYLAQEPSIFRGLTARENLKAVAEFIYPDMREAEKKIDALMEEMGIIHCAQTLAASLSGGEKRRVEIARVLLTNPSFLLLDEPFVGIDPIAVEELKKLVTKLKEKNIGILITDHNARDTLKIIDRAYLICDGLILMHGTSRELIESEKAREIYLGRNFEA
ncbi:LPS export ABC transporter ATP-binding protein [bacterium]|nr:LPS export ABC transporter ATP-binding protein [bacterium]MBU3956014.1 LPS export ABC transporter ATP-binding protein [bacterium]